MELPPQYPPSVETALIGGPMLNRNNLNIAKLASKADSKYTLAGILVTPTHTVVTDGHTLMAISNPAFLPEEFPKVGDLQATADFEPFILPAETALNIAKVMPKKEKIPILNSVAIGEVKRGESGEQLSALFTTDLETSNRYDVHCINSQFPRWQVVIPEPEKASLTLTVNAKYLIGLLQQFVTAGSPAVTVRLYTAETQIRLDGVSTQGQHITGVLMPMRTAHTEAVNYELTTEAV